LELLASLKFTVAPFLFAMVIVFIGSLAQAPSGCLACDG
jgi:hypothetical protein